MVLILVDGVAKGLCDKPNYVKKKNDIWIDGTKEEHDAIAIGGVAYESAIVKEIDSGEFVFDINSKTSQNVKDVSDIQDALVELADMISESMEV